MHSLNQSYWFSSRLPLDAFSGVGSFYYKSFKMFINVDYKWFSFYNLVSYKLDFYNLINIEIMDDL